MVFDAPISTICHFPTTGLSYLYHHHAPIHAFFPGEIALQAAAAAAAAVLVVPPLPHPLPLLHSSPGHLHVG